MPARLGTEGPALLLALDHLGRKLLPGDVGDVLRDRGTADGDDVGDEGVEEPVLLGAPAGPLEVAGELAELLADLDAELDAAVPERLAGLALVHLGVDVERREQRVEGRGRGVDQEGFVEPLVLDEAALAPDVLVALVDLRGLREAGALLVDGLGGEQARHLGPQRRQPHGAVVVEERVEGVVADPGLVPQHVVAEVPDLLEHLAHVVDRAVVGRELDAGEPERALRPVPLGVGHQRVRARSARGGSSSSQASQSTAPIMPNGLRAVGRKIGMAPAWTSAPWCRDLWLLRSKRTRSPRPQHGVRHHLVRGAGAVQDEVGLVGAEDLRRMLLGLRGRPLVDQQVAEVDVGVAEVVAEDALAEVLEEDLPGWRLPVELAALVARAVERDVRLAVVGHQPAEEGRQQRLAVVHQARHDLLGVEGRRLLPEIDVAVDLAGEVEHR